MGKSVREQEFDLQMFCVGDEMTANLAPGGRGGNEDMRRGGLASVSSAKKEGKYEMQSV